MASKVCNYNGCNNLIKLNETYCNRHSFITNRDRHKNYKVRRNDKDEKVFYNSKEWHIVRTNVIARDLVLCKVCLSNNRIRVANVVHHIIELKESRELGLKTSNLLSLCNSCHQEIHDKYRKGIVTKRNTQEELMKLMPNKGYGDGKSFIEEQKGRSIYVRKIFFDF
ncbi:HNH endonuclease [Clostridium perfringens]|uniref:HNH endonuclease signature motif containing protein n=1 Tax=Clostridium perfringens TaxID=1502 RepID=UPI0013E28E88|nr:HNH endonuclease signature motif containing protein [Clostridium perfringens]MBI6022840.1 HNH endonuclease [Clostridium perfringens]MBI6043630.1 HNH endonuclease [Clostridium perfringens]MBI6046050.1 HNH endonuclease [Clostridium perfringens]MDJ8925866.1 HNH endonuclease signature motif containing protein [Clostridium perfringens]MDJ8928697.1 HNH endonuclease signature motif containing protein [Clostridium perfringens]